MDFVIGFAACFVFYTAYNRLVIERWGPKTRTWRQYQWLWLIVIVIYAILAAFSTVLIPSLLGVYAALIVTDVIHKKRADKIDAAKSK